jgi:hypothetical protein
MIPGRTTMGFYRNDRNVFTALAANEERRRLDEEAASGRLRAVEASEDARARDDQRRGLAGRIRSRIRRVLGR